MPVIGFLGLTTPWAMSQWAAAFVRRLRELGWIEGRNVAIEYRWAEGRPDRYAEIAAEFVQRKVDVIVTSGTSALAARQATASIPIVFAVASDPVGTGLVAGLARPGGNATGLSLQGSDLAGKRVELLREVVPGLRQLAIMADLVGASANAFEKSEVQAAAQALGLDVVVSDIRRVEDIAPAFEALKGRAEALYVCTNALVSIKRVQISTLALAARLPTMHSVREYVEAAGLMSYGPSFSDLFRRSAEMVNKILRGTKPADIPVEQPTKFELVVNLTTAKALGLTIPESFLWRADEVIE
jgi:putative ABC transport system substrate-binding protein